MLWIRSIKVNVIYKYTFLYFKLYEKFSQILHVINIFVCKMKTSDLKNYFKNFQIVNWTVIREIIYYFNV